MKKLNLSRVAFALSVATSLTLSCIVVDTIAAQGMKAAAALRSSQTVVRPLHARSILVIGRNAADARVC
jgi:hypothetical protein